jgi:hypothetical protein
MTLRVGYNIHNKARSGQDRSAAEKAYLPTMLEQLNASALVIMDDLPFAEAMYKRLPNTIVIYRQFNEAEGHLWKVITPEQYFINQKGISKPGIPLYVINEPNSKADVAELNDRIKWLVRVMELYAAAGLSLVVDNLGPGHPDFTNFTDNAKWAVIKPLFDAFKRYPQMYWAMHPYWSKDGLRPQDGQSARHRDIEKLLKLRGYEMPSLIFTEMGRDAYGGAKTNGWRSTGISEESYAAEILESRNTLWTEPYIRGACLYCYGSVTQRWAAFDVESAKVLHRALIAGNQIVAPTPPPPFVIIPADKGTGEPFTIQLGSTLQAKASTDVTCKVGSLIPGERVNVYRKPSEVADGFTWHYFERVSTPVGESPHGWSSHTLPPPIIIEPPPSPSTADGDIRLVAAKYSMIETLEAEIQVLQGEIKIILSKWYTSMAA